jgi:hypothetical protein
VAQAEWQLYGAEQAEASQSLALREPQQKAAELSLRTAETGLEQAKIQHGRTLIKAPFDAVVRSNSTDAGRLVTPGQSLANLIDTSLFLVSVSVPPADLAWLKIPGTNAPALTRDIADKARAAEDPRAAFAELSSLVRVSQRIGNERIERSGVIIRMLGDLDPAGRMARLLVSVRDPLGREDQALRDENEAHRLRLHRAYVGNRIVTYDDVQNYTVPIFEHNGVVYAFTGDLDKASLLRLAGSARFP